MTAKQLVRSFAFMLAVCVMLLVLCEIFELTNNSNMAKRHVSFRNLEKGTVDVAFIGTSGIDRYWVAPQAFEEYGISSWPVTIDALPVWLYTNLIDEVLRYQNPELLVLDIRPFTQSNLSANTVDVRSRRVLDSISFFSQNRIKAAIKTSKVRHEIDPTLPKWELSYFLPFIKYHTKWIEDDFTISSNWIQAPHQYGGYHVFWLTHVSRPIEVFPVTGNTIVDLDPFVEKYLYEVLNYIKSKNLNVVFLSSPQSWDESEVIDSAFTTRVLQILDQEGFPYLAYYLDGQLKQPTDDIKISYLDPQQDFYNEGHTNFYGAQKYTRQLAEDLLEKYTLPDRRGQEVFEKTWNGIYDYLKNTIEENRRLEEEQANA